MRPHSGTHWSKTGRVGVGHVNESAQHSARGRPLISSATMFSGRKRHTPDSIEATDDILIPLLQEKLREGLTWKLWKAQRHGAGLPVWRSRLQQLQDEISDELLLSRPLVTERGAWVDVGEAIREVTARYQPRGLFWQPPAIPAISCLWKVSFDNRYIFGKHNEGFFIQPLTVFNPQSPAHVTSVAVALVKEDNATLRSVLVETKLDDVLYQLERTMFVVNGAVVPGDYQLCGDWISLHAELDTDVSNSRDADALTCYSCWIQKSELKETWLEAPFQYYKPCRTMADFPNSALPGVPLYKRRYCWMHGVTRLTSTTLGHLYGTIPARDALKNEFRAIMDSVHPDWTEDANLQCKEMKQLLRGGQPVLLSSLFDTRAVEAYPWPTEQRSVDFTPREMAELVLCSLRVYHDFAYTKWPSAQAFLTLWHARQALLAFYAGKRLPLTPTSHFMFNKGLRLATRADGVTEAEDWRSRP